MALIMFFEFLIGLTDIYIAGRFGKEVQAAYGFAVQLYFIFIILANALTVGTVSVVSRLFTSENREELTRAVFSSYGCGGNRRSRALHGRHLPGKRPDQPPQHPGRTQTDGCPHDENLCGRPPVPLCLDQFEWDFAVLQPGSRIP